MYENKNMPKNRPKYEIVKEYLIKSIENKVFLPGHSIPSEYDLCKIFNVSRIVVRKAVDELVIRGFLYRIQGKGTFVAENFEGQKNGINNNVNTIKVGILVPYVDSFSRTILSSAERELAKQGVLTFLVQTFSDQNLEENKLFQLSSNGVSGFILFSTTTLEDNKNIASYINVGVPIVFVDRFVKGWPFDAVIGQDYEAGFEAVEHFYLKHNIRKIGFFGADQCVVSSVRNRIEGFKKGLEQYGLSLQEKSLKPVLSADIIQLIKTYLDDNQNLEGVVVANDIVAANFYSVCAKMGIGIPKDLKIISFMNDEYAKFLNPPLTSFDQNLRELGRVAARTLLDKLNGTTNKGQIIKKVSYHLIIRESCGCKPDDLN